MKPTNSLTMACWLFTFLFNYHALAQKLPRTQSKSIYAPANVKIDGKALEINDIFEAYNPATEIYYTLYNNSDYLYLTIQAVRPDIVNRILNGGISFFISSNGKKDDKEALAISYPVTDTRNKMVLNIKGIDLLAPATQGTMADSLMIAYNRSADTKFKTIRTKGIKQVDSLLSIYNDMGVKAVGAFNKKLYYTCEFALPIKYLGLKVAANPSFVYQIKINPTDQQGISIPNANSNNSLDRLRGISVGANAVAGQYQTDFWGEYALASKP